MERNTKICTKIRQSKRHCLYFKIHRFVLVIVAKHVGLPVHVTVLLLAFGTM